MKAGDSVFYWTFVRGKTKDYRKLVIGRIRDTNGTYARVASLPTAPSAMPVQTIEVKRLKPVSELPPNLKRLHHIPERE